MSIEKPEKLDVLFHLGMDQKMTACLALLGRLREVRCSFISTSSPSAPNNLREVCSECSTRSCGGHRRGSNLQVVVNCLQQAQQGVTGTEPHGSQGHPSILLAVARKKS